MVSFNLLLNCALTYTLAKTWEEARVSTNFAQYEDPDLYPMTRGSIDPLARLENYAWNTYPRISDPLPIGAMTTIANPKPLAIRVPPDPIMDSITKRRNLLNWLYKLPPGRISVLNLRIKGLMYGALIVEVMDIYLQNVLPQ